MRFSKAKTGNKMDLLTFVTCFWRVGCVARSLRGQGEITLRWEKGRKLERWPTPPPKKKNKKEGWVIYVADSNCATRECLPIMPYMETCMRGEWGWKAWCNAPAHWEPVENMTAKWKSCHEFGPFYLFVQVSQPYQENKKENGFNRGHIYLNHS